MTAPLTLQGATIDGCIAFNWTRDDGTETDVVTLDETSLTLLLAAFTGPTLPLYPRETCTHCETDAVCVIEGRPHCEGHAMGFGAAEDEGAA